MNKKKTPIDANGYTQLLDILKMRIRQAQIRGSLGVNRELVLLYWQIGRDILAWQKTQGGGIKIIDQLSSDLKHSFPDMKGFSSRSIQEMLSIAEAYPAEEIVQKAAAQVPWGYTLRA